VGVAESDPVKQMKLIACEIVRGLVVFGLAILAPDQNAVAVIMT
jgi:hypothetical protein